MSHHLLVIIPGQELCICDFIPQGNLVEGCGNEASVAIRNLHKIIQIENIRTERSTQVSLSPSPIYFSLNQAASNEDLVCDPYEDVSASESKDDLLCNARLRTVTSNTTQRATGDDGKDYKG